MNRKDLTDDLSKRLGIPFNKVSSILKSFCETIARVVSKGKTITFRGFGRFVLKETKPRKYYDIHTKSIRTSTPKIKIVFRPATKFIDYKGDDIGEIKEVVRLLAFAGNRVADFQYLSLIFIQLHELYNRSNKKYNFCDFAERKCLATLKEEKDVTYLLILRIIIMFRQGLRRKEIIEKILSEYKIERPEKTDLHVNNRRQHQADRHAVADDTPGNPSDESILGSGLYSLARNRRGMEYANIIAAEIYNEYCHEGKGLTFEEYVQQYCKDKIDRQDITYTIEENYTEDDKPGTRPRKRTSSNTIKISPRQLVRPASSEDENVNILLSIFDSLVSYRPHHLKQDRRDKAGSPENKRQYSGKTRLHTFQDLITYKYDKLDKINLTLLYNMMYIVASMREEGKSKEEITQYLKNIAVRKIVKHRDSSTPTNENGEGREAFNTTFSPEQLELIGIIREFDIQTGSDTYRHIVNIISEYNEYYTDTPFRQHCRTLAERGKIFTQRAIDFICIKDLLTAFSESEDKEWIIRRTVDQFNRLASDRQQTRQTTKATSRTAITSKEKKTILTYYGNKFRSDKSGYEAMIYTICQKIDRSYMKSTPLKNLTRLACEIFYEYDTSIQDKPLTDFIESKAILSEGDRQKKFRVIRQIAIQAQNGTKPRQIIAELIRSNKNQHSSQSNARQKKKDTPREKFLKEAANTKQDSANIATLKQLQGYCEIVRTHKDIIAVSKNGIYAIYRKHNDNTVTVIAPFQFKEIDFVTDSKWKLGDWNKSYIYFLEYNILCHLEKNADTYQIYSSENPHQKHLFFNDMRIMSASDIKNIRNDDLFAFSDRGGYRLAKVKKSGNYTIYTNDKTYYSIEPGSSRREVILRDRQETIKMQIPE